MSTVYPKCSENIHYCKYKLAFVLLCILSYFTAKRGNIFATAKRASRQLDCDAK